MNGLGFDDRALDRLIDGELDEDRRRELLAQLDSQPDGWRRCALAFLESQALAAALGPKAAMAENRAVEAGAAAAAERGEADGRLRPSTAQPSQTTVPSRRAGQPRGNRRAPLNLRPWLNALAMTACFLIALNIGLQWRDGGPGPVGGGASGTAQRVPSGSQTASTPESALAARSGPGSGWQTVTLAVPDATSGGTAQVQLPCRESERLDEQWLQSLPGAISPEARRALERSGYQVRQHRQLVPLQLEDGRRLVVPVDQVELRFVGDEVY